MNPLGENLTKRIKDEIIMIITNEIVKLKRYYALLRKDMICLVERMIDNFGFHI
jgi:hypothetical protein